MRGQCRKAWGFESLQVDQGRAAIGDRYTVSKTGGGCEAPCGFESYRARRWPAMCRFQPLRPCERPQVGLVAQQTEQPPPKRQAVGAIPTEITVVD